MIEKFTEVASKLTNSVQDTFDKSSKIVTEKLNLHEHYSYATEKYTQLKGYVPPTITDGLNNTRLVIGNGTQLVYSFPYTVGDKFCSFLPPVDTSEEVARAHPHDRLAEGVSPVKDDRKEIVNSLLDLYSSKLSNETVKYYHEEVVYEDQFIYTSGLANLIAQFYGSAKLVKYTVLDYKILENTQKTLRISLTQKYVIPFVGRYLSRDVIIVLDFDEEGKKVVKHTHLLWGKQPNQLVILRKGAGRICAILVKSPEI